MKNQEKYAALLAAAGITQAASAELIAAETQRPCSVRAVRAWLADPSKPSARECPEWAVQALERRLKKNKKIVA